MSRSSQSFAHLRPLSLDFEVCYRAVCSRDARFDGQFFTAVTSTGIYCRPICPAPTPKAAHVRFYGCAAAAAADGFRACRRCRPEASPGSPEWNIRADLVARALRLISEGIIDTEGVAGLAQRLAVSERHLHRELVAEVGVGPLALARTRRAQTARLLIDETDLALTEIAYASGFASLRQFNDTMLVAFGCPPSALRRRGRPEHPGGGGLTVRLQYRPPFDAEALLAFLAQRALAGVEEVGAGRYRRTVALPRSTGIVELEPNSAAQEIVVRLWLTDLRDVSLLVQRCRHLLDLDTEPTTIAGQLSTDPLLAALIARHPGLRVPGTLNSFELAVRAILGQQISVARARTLVERLVQVVGDPLPRPVGTLTHLFPSPERVAQANLQALGLTARRAATLHALAEGVATGAIVLDRGADRAQTISQLLAVPGIGPWTAAYIAMHALGDPDAFPATDLGLRHALERGGYALSPGGLAAHAEAWRPWRSYAVMHLWTSLTEQRETRLAS